MGFQLCRNSAPHFWLTDCLTVCVFGVLDLACCSVRRCRFLHIANECDWVHSSMFFVYEHWSYAMAMMMVMMTMMMLMHLNTMGLRFVENGYLVSAEKVLGCFEHTMPEVLAQRRNALPSLTPSDLVLHPPSTISSSSIHPACLHGFLWGFCWWQTSTSPPMPANSEVFTHTHGARERGRRWNASANRHWANLTPCCLRRYDCQAKRNQ